MIRVLVDDHGTRSDIIVGVDGSPERLFETDTGWLYSFCRADDMVVYQWSEQQRIEEKQQDIGRLIQFRQELLTNGQPTVYSPIDLAD